MNRGRGINDRDDRSNGIEIRMADALAKINPTDLNPTKAKKNPTIAFSCQYLKPTIFAILSSLTRACFHGNILLNYLRDILGTYYIRYHNVNEKFIQFKVLCIYIPPPSISLSLGVLRYKRGCRFWTPSWTRRFLTSTSKKPTASLAKTVTNWISYMQLCSRSRLAEA
jgi:hypothetical protein